jgi:UDP-glucose 4-epimerase
VKVAITGGNGQLGRYVVDAFEPDHEVTVVDRVDLGNRQPIGPVDLLDLEKVKLALAGQQAVVHLGGLDAAVDATPEQFFHTNTIATWNVMHAGCEVGVSRFSLCSSTSAYGFSLAGQRSAPDYLPIDESHRLRASDPYGLSKRVLEEIGSGFSERENVSVSFLRPCYVAFDPLLPRLVCCKNDEPEPDGGEWKEALPPLRWVVAPEDVAQCFRLAIENVEGLEVFNVCADDTFSSTPTRTRVQAVFGVSIPERQPAWFDGNPFASLLDNSKAKRLLGWQPNANWDVLAKRGKG